MSQLSLVRLLDHQQLFDEDEEEEKRRDYIEHIVQV